MISPTGASVSRRGGCTEFVEVSFTRHRSLINRGDEKEIRPELVEG